MSNDTLNHILNGRSIVIDLEMTGLPLEDGHRVVSVGLVELINGVEIGQQVEYFTKPERPNTEIAAKMHGLSDEFLAEQPLFSEQLEAMLEFIGDAPLIHHCHYGQDGHSTDEMFFEMELKRAGTAPIAHERWLNTKKWAQVLDADKNSLNNMLERFDISTEGRDSETGHGALVDAVLSAQVFMPIAKAYEEKTGDMHKEPPHNPNF